MMIPTSTMMDILTPDGMEIFSTQAALMALKPTSYVTRVIAMGLAFAGAMDAERVWARVVGLGMLAAG
jgi:hypothetical protein